MVTHPGVPEITVHELKALMDDDRTPFVLDVRSKREYAAANLQGRLIPLKLLVDHLDEIEAHKEEMIVVHCRSGARSAQAVRFLMACGFKDVKNLRGGTLAWSREIDPTMPEH